MALTTRWSIYTDNDTKQNGKEDTLELRPFIGAKLFLPNKLKWNIYNFTRLEFRQVYHHDTHEWTHTQRLRSRFGVEIPMTARANAWNVKTFYFVANTRIRPELLYYANWGRVGAGNTLAFNQNIIRLNIKVGVSQALLGHIWNP